MRDLHLESRRGPLRCTTEGIAKEDCKEAHHPCSVVAEIATVWTIVTTQAEAKEKMLQLVSKWQHRHRELDVQICLEEIVFDLLVVVLTAQE